MDMRTRNATLEMNIHRALQHRLAENNILVTADCQGVVSLRGKTRDKKSTQEIEAVVLDTPGVTQVFCHMTLKNGNRSS
jgi:osmotically-inducible protein OsmY